MGKDKKPKLSKKELRKIEEKIARKAEKKAAKKRERMAAATESGKTKGAERPTESAESASGAVDESGERHPHLQHLDRIAELQLLLDPDQPKKVRKAAQEELDQLRAAGEKINAKKTVEQQDAEMRERILAKRAERDLANSIDQGRKMQQDVADRRGRPGPAEVLAERAAAAEKLTLADVTPEADAEESPQYSEADKAEIRAAVEASAAVEPAAPAPVESAVENFAKPSEAPVTDFETNGLGQYKVKRPSDGKMVGYTRTTTYIAVLEDVTALTKWKMRILLEGVVAAETPDDDGKMDPVTARVRDLVHNRDVAIAKARKADRKGKLHPGQLATLVDGAWGDFKRAMDSLAEEVFEIGGGREAATKGTDIHALCELYDAEGMDAVQEKLDAGEITPADFADVEAYADACRRLGLKVVASEQVIVNDDLKVAGRLDRIVLARLPEIRDPKTGEVLRVADARAKRYVLDVKTGRIDYGTGKIAQQIRMYAESNAYDLDTHERTSHGANRTAGLVLHLPAGSGKATVHLVDLAIGGRGNKLAGEVRAFRNEGRKAINQKIDLVQLATAAAAEAEEAQA